MRARLFPATVFALVALLLALWIVNVVILPPNADACVSNDVVFRPLAEGGTVLDDFHTCNPWYATGIRLEKGATYKVEANERDVWKDWDVPANADGFVHQPGLMHKLLAFSRRYKARREVEHLGWFRLIASIGGRQQVSVGRGAEFTAEYSGPLYFYVNDALCDICLKGVFAYYRNNHGTAEISVARVKKAN